MIERVHQHRKQENANGKGSRNTLAAFISAPNGRQLTGQTPGLPLVLDWIVIDGVCAIQHHVSSMLYNIDTDKSQATDSSGVGQNTALSSCFVVGGIYAHWAILRCSLLFSSWIATDTELSRVILGARYITPPVYLMSRVYPLARQLI
jgi:hypothetical protein